MYDAFMHWRHCQIGRVSTATMPISLNHTRSKNGSGPATSTVRGYLAVFLSLLPTVAAGCRSKWKQLRGDITEYKLITVLKVPKITDCLMKSSAAEAHAASFDAEVGRLRPAAVRPGRQRRLCRKCRHEKDASLPMLWVDQGSVGDLLAETFHSTESTAPSASNRSWSEYASGDSVRARVSTTGWDWSSSHQLTATGAWRVRWEFSDWNDNWYWLRMLRSL
uniref:Secreted protein n=1 Tax=Macrostomum lignano TaxID=282301 RepID=A0A1I8JSA9_9PLAT